MPPSSENLPLEPEALLLGKGEPVPDGEPLAEPNCKILSAKVFFVAERLSGVFGGTYKAVFLEKFVIGLALGSGLLRCQGGRLGHRWGRCRISSSWSWSLDGDLRLWLGY